MDKNKKNKKPLKLSSEGRLQLRKNLGPDQVKRQSSNKKSKTIQIVFKKKTSSKTDSSFSKRQVFSKRPEKRQETNQNNIKGKKFNKLFAAPILTKSDVHKKIDTKKFDNKKTNTKKIKRTLNPDDKVGKFDVNKVLQQEEQEYDKLPSLAKIKRAREREKLKTQSLDNTKVSRDVTIPEIITVQDLANRMAEKTADVVKELMKLGIMVTANQSIEGDTAELVATELGHKSNRVSDIDVLKDIEDIEDPEDELQSRPPVVTIMGHVDHGKTSILDSIRKSDVASKEAGGITQHIGAYQITTEKDKKITFIDTPGHEAFTNIRARGAKTTDIVVLVIAADDGIKPQTQEAISHAKAAKVPIIIAINKIDTPGANPEKVRTELLSYEIVVEKLSGEVQDVEVSATKNMNIDKLQEAILLQAEILNLKANPNRKSRGVVLESRLEKGRGPVATILIQKGTLKIGDVFVSGSEWGKIRALRNDKGEKEETALPGSPIEILGLNDNPQAGDDFIVVNSEFTAREIAKYRLSEKKKNLTINKSNVENMFEKIAAGEISKLPVIVKADVQGSADAIDSSLEKLSTNEVKTDVIFKGVGAITESDVALANSSKGFIIGFNVRAIPQARDMAKREGVDLKYYSVIYELIDDVKKLMGGLLSTNIS